MKKFFLWCLFFLPGAGLIVFFSQKAIESERQFFVEMFLNNNRDLAFLLSRHAWEQMNQIKSQMEGFTRMILKDGFLDERIRDWYRFHFERHTFLSGIRYSADAKTWVSLQSLEDQQAGNVFFDLKAEIPQKDYFSSVYKIHGFYYISWIQRISDVRANKVLGVVEARIRLDRLIDFARALVTKRGDSILLCDQSGAIFYPAGQGFTLEKSEVEQMRKEPLSASIREDDEGADLLSWCSLRVVDQVHMPALYILVFSNHTRIDSITDRLRWNLWLIMGIGLSSLGFLLRLLIRR